MYALNLSEDGRILSACEILPNGCYDGMPVVETLPDGNVYEHLYVDGEYIHDPLPKTEPEEPALTSEERIAALEEELAATKILLGVE